MSYSESPKTVLEAESYYGTTPVWCRGGSRNVEGCWGFPHLKIEKLAISPFMFFDRYVIHIRDFEDFCTAINNINNEIPDFEFPTFQFPNFKFQIFKLSSRLFSNFQGPSFQISKFQFTIFKISKFSLYKSSSFQSFKTSTSTSSKS